MRQSNDELIDIDVKIHRASMKAIMVSTTGEEGDAVWIPRSQCKNGNALERGFEGQIQVKQWIAEREGLI